MAKEGLTRITAEVPDVDVDRLEKMSEGIRSNKTTALVRAIRIADILDDAKRDGSQIVIVDKDGSKREIILP